ncbi:MAG: NADH-quinone oxidoreductase subunit N [Dehalococcoidia bacterium]
MNSIDIVGPQLSVLGAAGVVLLIDALLPQQRRWLPFVALLGLATSALWSLSWAGRADWHPDAFGGTFSLDQYAIFFYFLFAGITATVVLASIDWVNREGRGQGEYYALVLTTCAGLMFLSAGRDLITIFLALELSSIPQYILAGWGKDQKSSEAGLKYLLLGAIASSLLLYGMALLYGVTGTTLLDGIAASIQTDGESYRALLVLSMVLMIAGFGFKMAVVPFQMWVPDVYQGAPTPVAAFLSVGSKAAAFAVVTRIFFVALPAEFLSDDWSMVFAIIAAVSMTAGNLAAIVQTDIKRMLGYSSIAQAGTFMIGLAAISVNGDEFTLGASGVLLYTATYAFTNLGAFVAIIAISQKIGSDQIKDYAGMWKRSPFLSLALAFCLVSLTGIPPTAGFWAKMYVFNAGMRADLAWLVIVGVLNSVLSGYYYLAVVRQMFLGDAEDGRSIRTTPSIGMALGAATLGVLIFGIIPMPLISAAENAVEVFNR